MKKFVTETARMHPYLLLLVIFLGPTLWAQSGKEQADDPSVSRYYPYHSNKLQAWGYSNEDGHILIKPAYEEVRGFFKGFACTKGKNGWGIINEKGNWVIQPGYDDIFCSFYGDEFWLTKGEEITAKKIEKGKLVDTELPDFARAFEEPGPYQRDDEGLARIGAMAKILSDSYDKVWTNDTTTSYPIGSKIYYARKNGKIAILELDPHNETLPSPLQIIDADDVFESEGDDNEQVYYFKKDGKLGIVFYTNVTSWRHIDARFKNIKTEKDWFLSFDSNKRQTYFFSVTMPDGRTGFVNTKGVLLFD